MIRSLLVAAVLGAASPALAQYSLGDSSAGRSGRWGSVDVGAGTYTPNIDAESPTSPGPYETFFGGGRGWMFNLGISRALFTKVGALEVGFRTGYFQKSANGLVEDPANPGTFIRAGADSSLRIIPTSVALSYRFDVPVERYRIPFAPYGRVAFERYNWWITKGTGGTVEKGATMGWSATGGLAFLLDILDPVLAREFDRDSGVNHTYLFFEVTKSSIDDFGSSKSWDLSTEDLSLAGGLTFVF